MHVLHLVDPGSLGGGGTTLRLVADLVARQPSVRQTALVMGSLRHVDLARRCGLDPVGSVRSPLAATGWAARPLVRALDAIDAAARAAGDDPVDLVHAWSLPSAVAATLAAGDRPCLATLSVGPPNDLSTWDAARRLRDHRIRFTATSAAVAGELTALGIAPDRVAVLPAAVDPETVAEDREQVRRRLRSRWGIADETFAIGLFSEPLAWGDARLAADIVARVAACDRDVRVVVHPAARRRADAERWARRVHLGDLLVVDDDLAEPWSVVPAFDAVIAAGGGTTPLAPDDVAGPWRLAFGTVRRRSPMPGVVPLLWAMAGGVPVIAETSAAVRDVVEEGVTGLLVPPGDTGAFADRILRLCDDRTIGGRIGAAAHEQVERRHHASAWSVRMRSVHEQVMQNRPLEIDEARHEPQAA